MSNELGTTTGLEHAVSSLTLHTHPQSHSQDLSDSNLNLNSQKLRRVSLASTSHNSNIIYNTQQNQGQQFNFDKRDKPNTLPNFNTFDQSTGVAVGAGTAGTNQNNQILESNVQNVNMENMQQLQYQQQGAGFRSENFDHEYPENQLELEEWSFDSFKVIGNGSFGVVFAATVLQTGKTVAVKKVFLDPRFKNREVQIMRKLSHPNVVQLLNWFYRQSTDPSTSKPKTYLFLVLEFVPDTLSNLIKHFKTIHDRIPIVLVQTYMYQTFKALEYIHGKNVCHRDIKPQNLLIDPSTFTLKLADFGSAKILQPNAYPPEPNTTYICSRYYRAPELLFGSNFYSFEIDIWAAGCVLAELFILQPLFPGVNHVDQLLQIIKLLGTPTTADIQAMNEDHSEISLPKIERRGWDWMFSHDPYTSTIKKTQVISLLERIMVYNPKRRLNASQVLDQSLFLTQNDYPVI